MTIPLQIYSECRLCGRSSDTTEVRAMVDILRGYGETVPGLQLNYDFPDKQCQQQRDIVLSTLQDVIEKLEKTITEQKATVERLQQLEAESHAAAREARSAAREARSAAREARSAVNQGQQIQRSCTDFCVIM